MTDVDPPKPGEHAVEKRTREVVTEARMDAALGATKP